ncbi:MAG: DUF3144 domain-containing protein [Pseudomonadota bacterium]
MSRPLMNAEQTEQHDNCMARFIDLANEMSKEGLSTSQVSWALMSASGIFATYAAAGNAGGLSESGIEKVVDAYKQNLTNIQALKKAAGKHRG